MRTMYLAGIRATLFAGLLLAATSVLAQPEQAGSAAVADGQISVSAADGSTRSLHDGDPVYSGDTITTGDDGYVDLELDDQGRILLHPGTVFEIEKYHFDPSAHGLVGNGSEAQQPVGAATTNESSIFRLFKGALRAIDGLIGQSHPDNYAMHTPVATIGIRGTQYDVRYCADNCQAAPGNGGSPENGLYTAVNEGSIGVQTESGVSVLKKGAYGFLSGRKAKLRHLKRLPGVLKDMSLPRRLEARAERMRRLINKRRLQRWKSKFKSNRLQRLRHRIHF